MRKTTFISITILGLIFSCCSENLKYFHRRIDGQAYSLFITEENKIYVENTEKNYQSKLYNLNGTSEICFENPNIKGYTKDITSYDRILEHSDKSQLRFQIMNRLDGLIGIIMLKESLKEKWSLDVVESVWGFGNNYLENINEKYQYSEGMLYYLNGNQLTALNLAELLEGESKRPISMWTNILSNEYEMYQISLEGDNLAFLSADGFQIYDSQSGSERISASGEYLHGKLINGNFIATRIVGDLIEIVSINVPTKKEKLLGKLSSQKIEKVLKVLDDNLFAYVKDGEVYLGTIKNEKLRSYPVEVCEACKFSKGNLSTLARIRSIKLSETEYLMAETNIGNRISYIKVSKDDISVITKKVNGEFIMFSENKDYVGWFSNKLKYDEDKLDLDCTAELFVFEKNSVFEYFTK